MAKFTYSPDVDILVVTFSDKRIDHAEDHGPFILHFSEKEELVAVEILEARGFLLESLKAVMQQVEVNLVPETH